MRARLCDAWQVSETPDLARSFGAVAKAYDHGRPDYSPDAVRWLVGEHPTTVLELGAGTGKLTRTLVDLGHDVHATEPDPEMLAVLRTNLPDVRASRGGAEEITAPDNSYDVVIAGQAFHWFDHQRAIPEIARVLKNGGRLGLLWNFRDDRIPWVKRLGRLIGNAEHDFDPITPVQAPYDHLHWFMPVETHEFKHWQHIDPDVLHDLVLSRSYISTLPDEEREAKLAEVRDFYADFGRGYDGMQLPYVTRCYLAQVIDRLMSTSTQDQPITDDGDDGLLIDFR